jgi:ribosomal protein S12 methylthiotransferase accessory factor
LSGIDRLLALHRAIDRADPAGLHEKSFIAGMHRRCAPEETLARLEPMLPRLGLTRIANVTGLDRIGIPVVMVHRPNSRSYAVYQGKGLTLAAAKTSGIMESIERLHAERIAQTGLLASIAEARERNLPILEPETLPQKNGQSLDRGQPIRWIEGFDLMRGRPALLPCDVVHFDLTVPQAEGTGIFPNSSTGLAAGNDPAEALLHALCEIIERDAATLWRLFPSWRQQRSRLDPASIEETGIRALLDRIEAADLRTVLWEITSDVGVPAYLCRLLDFSEAGTSPMVALDGAGCHPDPMVAMTRAVTEAAQCRLSLISGARDDLFPHHFRSAHRIERAEQMALLKEKGPMRRLDRKQSLASNNLAIDCMRILGRLAAAGVKHVFAVDLTSAGIGIPVLRLVVPQLEDGEEMPDYLPRERALRALWGRQ